MVEDYAGNYTASIISMDGKLILKQSGTIKTIEEAVNNNLHTMQTGVYILSIEQPNVLAHRVKFIKH